MVDLTCISLGAGVQSSALLALAANDMLPYEYDRVDVAIFADTGDEPQAVYDWLPTLESIANKAGIGFQIVSAGKLSDDVLGVDGDEDRYRTMIPAYVGQSGGLLRRECTNKYKIQPVRAEIRRLLNRKSGKNAKVDCLLGISKDEAWRIRDSGLDYINNRYPLVDLGWSRQDCIDFMEDEGYGTPPRSSCIYCPYRSSEEWKLLHDEQYADFVKAVDFDEGLRANSPVDAPVYVHKSRMPLDSVDFTIVHDSLMGEECSGFCGV